MRKLSLFVLAILLAQILIACGSRESGTVNPTVQQMKSGARGKGAPR